MEEKRANELRWMVKGAERQLRRVAHLANFVCAEWANSICLTLLWSLISIVVPVSAFWFFVKVQREELTVAIAFTVSLQ
jgi:hypothetical protein